MSMNRDELSVRKELLLAQSALYRAQLRFEAVALRARVARRSGRILMVLSIVRIIYSLTMRR
jgi:hypothetical protein